MVRTRVFAGPIVVGVLTLGTAVAEARQAQTTPLEDVATSDSGDDGDDSSNVGLFGLFGLAGLAGLAGLRHPRSISRYDKRWKRPQ